MNQIELITVDDVVSVFNNWHQDILLIVDEMTTKVRDGDDPAYHMNRVRNLIEGSPFTSNHFINIPIMHSNVELIECIIND